MLVEVRTEKDLLLASMADLSHQVEEGKRSVSELEVSLKESQSQISQLHSDKLCESRGQSLCHLILSLSSSSSSSPSSSLFSFSSIPQC